jgi:general secretion pathway protein A
MYESFYGLSADPFRLSSDPRFCFPHRSYARAKAYVQYALYRAEGFVMITGRPGTGKTTLVNDLLATLPRREVVVATLVSTQLEAEDLLRMTAYGFGLDSSATHKSQVLQRLMEFFAQQHRQGLRSLLIIDEAQDLSASALEELRLLTNLQSSGHPLLQIVLLGQEALRALVHSRDMEQVHQRLIAAWHLEPLDPRETIGYVQHRLERAGWLGDPVFEPGVLALVHKFSQGVPRRINLICSRLLLHAFIAEQHAITPADALELIRELTQEELASPDQEFTDGAETAADETELTPADIAAWSELDQGLYGPSPSDEGTEPPPPAAAERPAAAIRQNKTVAIPTEEVRAARAEFKDAAPTRPAEPPPATLRENQPETIQTDNFRAARVELADDEFTLTTEPPAATDARGNSGHLPPRIVPERDWRFEQALPEEPEGPVGRRKARSGGLRFIAWTTAFVLLGFVVLVAVLVSRPEAIDAAEVRGSAAIDTVKLWWQRSAAEAPLEAAQTPRPPERQPLTGNPVPPPAVLEPGAAAGWEGLPRTPSTAPETAGNPDLVPTPPSTRPRRPAASSETLAMASTPAPADEAAEPASRASPPSSLITGQVFFGWNSTAVDRPFDGLLDEVAWILQESGGAHAEVIGWSDSVGNPGYNLTLSRQRAQAVANALVRRGVERDRLRVEGRGPAQSDR